MTFVQKKNAEMWQQTAVDLIEIARDDLQAASTQLQLLQVPTEDGTGMLASQETDGCAAARILLPAFRQVLIQTIAPQTGFIWVGVPNRDFLIAWSDDLAPATKQAITQQIALNAKQPHHPLCGGPLRVTPETIVPLE